MIRAPVEGEAPEEEFQCSTSGGDSSSSSGGDETVCVTEAFDRIRFAAKAVLTSMYWDNPCAMGVVELVWSPNQCERDVIHLPQFCGAVCPESSSGS